jgi:5-methylthioadenosine/S-adenosylhomocysteine deaminase
VIDLHAVQNDIEESLAAHGARPIERLWNLGLLTPALNAVHMTHATASDIALAERTGIAISLCGEAALRSEHRLPPAPSWVRSGLRLGLSSDGAGCRDLWGEMRMLALQCSPWDALTAATSGGAAAVGMDLDIGSLTPGKWADLCCIDLGGPATQPLNDPVTQLVLCGGRDLVNDVWVAGRPLLLDRELTRLDWAAAADRAHVWAERLKS